MAGEASKWLLDAPDTSSEGIIEGLLSLMTKEANAKRTDTSGTSTARKKRKVLKQDPLQQNLVTENEKILQHKGPETSLSGTAKLLSCASQTMLLMPEDVASIPGKYLCK